MAKILTKVSPNITLKHGQTGLHLATRLGHEDAVQTLLDASADCTIRDKKGNFALHYSIKYCLKNDPHFVLKKRLIDPILDRMPKDLLHQPNKTGTTCHHLLRGLELKQQLLRGPSSPSTTSDSSEDDWNEKLRLAETEDDVDASFPHGFAADDRETFDAWADRIYAEYLKRRTPRRQQQQQQSEETKPKPSAFKPVDQPLKLVDEKRSAKHDALFDLSTIRLQDLPFTQNTTAQEVLDIIVGETSDPRAKIREAIRRWHPDKFIQICGEKIVENDRENVMKIVTQVSQVLLRYGK